MRHADLGEYRNPASEDEAAMCERGVHYHQEDHG